MYQTPVKMDIKKKIELCVLLFLIFWGILFIVNYNRFNNSKPLILAFSTKKEYDDGIVQEYISLGYIYRSYQRNSISREELVPFWVGREEPQAEPDLPKAYTDYEVPENIKHEDKNMGLLYYYDSKYKLAGTYKCINTVMDCNKAFSGYDEFNLLNKDPLTALETQRTLGNFYDKFAFVDDSSKQDAVYGVPSYSRTIYLYQFLKEDPVILAKFADVKESTVVNGKGYGENNNFILKSMDNGKWGVMHIYENGDIEEVLPYEYQSITYDEDTKYYILCKDNIWYVYDLNDKKVVSAESIDPIYDVWRNDNLTYYFKTGKDRKAGTESYVDYKIFRLDGKQFLNIDKVTAILTRGSYVAYLTDNDDVLHFIDYSGDEKYKLQLYFSELNHDDFSHPAFEIFTEGKGYVTFKIWDGRDMSADYELKAVNTQYWR